jgi:hypothetical protein
MMAMDSKPQCTYPGCELLRFASCPHTARCGDHLFGDMCDEACCKELALTFVKFLRDVCAPAARLGEQLVLIRLPMLDDFAGVYDRCAPAYRDAYEEAGAPFGPDDDAMWRWHEERFSAPVN